MDGLMLMGEGRAFCMGMAVLGTLGRGREMERGGWKGRR